MGKRRFALAYALLATLASGCTGSSEAPTLRMQLPYEPATLDHSLAEDGASFRVLSALMTGLVSYDRDYGLKLEIAESMEKLDGGKRYRFNLRPWKWSDGQEVTAADFVFAFRRTLEPSTPAKLGDLLFFIKNARAYKSGKISDFSRVGVSAPSEKTLEFSLEGASSVFPHVLTLPIGLPQRADSGGRGPLPSPLPSTGPYRLVRWVHDQRLEIERNPTYPKFAPQAPVRAVFQIVPEEATALNLFENGRLDVLFKAPALELDRLRKRGTVREFPYFATYYLAFDQRQTPWADRKARLAIAQAIDRRAIVQAVGGGELPASSWVPRGLPGFDGKLGVVHDPAQAKKNWSRSKGASLKKLPVGYDSGSRNRSVIERVQSDLRRALGVELAPQSRDWKTYLRELATSTPPLFRFGWLSPFVDAYASLSVFRSDSPNNYTGWKSAAYDRLLDKIAAVDPADPARRAMIAEAQHILLERDVVVVPIFHYTQTVVISSRVRDFWVNGLGMVDYSRARIEDD